MFEQPVEFDLAEFSSLLSDEYKLIALSRSGLLFDHFTQIAERSAFSLKEWYEWIHLTERTLQRYRQGNKPFDPIHSERILEIARLLKLGNDVFGSPEKFKIWLDAENIALGSIVPKSLLDNTFGINILRDELLRIEHGILA